MIYKILFFSLPFTYAMTINIGITIKIYEIISIIFLGKQLLLNKIKYKNKYKTIYKILFYFFIFYFFINLLSIYSFSLVSHDYIWARGRFSPYVNSIFPILYLFLILFVLYTIVENINEKKLYKYISYWLYGAFFSTLYLIYCNVALYTILPEIILFGMDKVIYTSFFGNIIFARTGTFLEGGFLSGYLVASIILTHILYIQKQKQILILLGIYLFFGLLITLSTNGLVTLFLYFNIYYMLSMKKKSTLIKVIVIYLIFFLIIYFSPLYDLLYTIVYQKLFSDNINVSAMAYSKFDRLYHLQKGLELFKDNLFLGVGSYNFGYYFPLITDSNIFSNGLESKRIINNVYIQILAENGLFVFSLFLLIPLKILKKYITKKNKDSIDVASISYLIVILIKWNAYPTYLLLYDWVGISLIIFIIWRENDNH